MSTFDAMEPQARAVQNVNNEPQLTSIAVSLKRIADALDGTTLGVDISESHAGLTLVAKDIGRGTI